MLLISAAHAADAAAQEPSALQGLLPLIIMFVVFYFLLIRPQQKKYKQHQQMVTSLRRGDKVVTAGGLVGKITKVDTEADSLKVEIASGVEVEVVRSTIASVVNRTGKADGDTAEKPAKTTKKKAA